MTDKLLTIRVPCSTSNLGPGLDCLGLALSLFCTTRIEPLAAGHFEIDIDSPAQPGVELPRDASNLLYRAMHEVARKVGKSLPSVRIQVQNQIPVYAGLGSSGAIRLSAVLAANALLGDPLDTGSVLAMAIAMEGHPDNVTPSFFGGLTVSLPDGAWVRVVPPDPPCVLVFHPNLVMPTQQARRLLPEQVSRSDAVANAAGTAAIAVALATGRPLHPGMFRDRLHQPYRSTRLVWFDPVLTAAERAGASGCFLSGSGPSVAMFVTPAVLGKVQEAVSHVFAKYAVQVTPYRLHVVNEGAQIVVHDG